MAARPSTNVLNKLSLGVGADNDTFKYISVVASHATSFVQTVKGILLTLDRDTMSGITEGPVPGPDFTAKDSNIDLNNPILKLAFNVTTLVDISTGPTGPVASALI